MTYTKNRRSSVSSGVELKANNNVDRIEKKVAKMLFANQLQNLARVSFVLLFLSIIIGSPALANEEPITNPKPLNIPSGNSQDLEGLKAKTSSQWLGVAGEDRTFVDTPTAYEPQMNAFVMKTVAVNQFWRRASTTFADTTGEADPNLGDPKRSGIRIPIIQFRSFAIASHGVRRLQ